MPIRLSGLVSGLDTDALVQDLMSAYSIKKDNYVKQQTKLQWQMDAWKALNTKIYSFYSNKLSPLRFSSAYNKKKAVVSDSVKASVTASNDAPVGDQTLAINRLAKTGYLTGAELKGDANGKKITGKTKISDLEGFSAGTVKVTVDGKEKNINVTANMTVNDFIVKLKEAGLNANFDETNQRMFIFSKESGKDHDFTLTGSDAGGVSVLQGLGIFALTDADKAQYEAISKWSDDDIKNFAINDYLQKQIAAANQTYTDRNKELSAANTELNSKLAYAKKSAQAKADAYAGVQSNIETLNARKAELQEEIDRLQADDTEDHTEAIEALQKQIEDADKKITSNQETLAMYDEVNAAYGISNIRTEEDEDGNKTVLFDEDADEEQIEAYRQTINDQIAANNEEIKANNDAIKENNKLAGKTYTTEEAQTIEFTSYAEGGIIMTQVISADYENEEAYKELVDKYTAMRDSADAVLAGDFTTSGATRIVGEDAEIVLNGATFHSSSNNFSINGLTITAQGVTDPGEELTITTSTDVDGIYDMIKDFITSYNELIKEMDTLFNASSSKGYEPLTDEEKDAMTDTEIEKWEAKIKDSLLRRDSTLDGVINAMKTSMSASFKIGGQSFSLASFGISTLGYFTSGENEKGVFHIDGDSADGSTSGNKDKLRAAIANDPDSVVNFFSQLAAGMYNTLTKKMATSSVSSIYTVYNDKEMQRKYNEYSDTIKKWEEKITAMEEKYYKQFSAMETAMAKLQSSTSALSMLMGGGSY